VLAFVCVLVPLFWLLWLLLRTIMRACCQCCLARKREVASRKRVLFNHVGAAFFGCACVAGAACVWASGPMLRKTLQHIVDLGLEQTKLMLTQALAVIAVLNNVTPALRNANASTADITDATKTLQSAADAVNAALDDNEGMIADGLERLSTATSILGAFLILLVLLAWLGHALVPRRAARHFIGASLTLRCVQLARHNVACSSGFVNFLQWLFLVLGWVICGITYILFLLVSDACLALPDALADPVSAGLAKRLPCLDPAFSSDASSTARAPIYDGIDGANQALQACSVNGPTIPYLCNPIALATGVYTDRTAACAARYATVPSTAVAFSASYTASTCPNPQVRNQFGVLGAGVEAAMQLDGVMGEVDALVSCQFITATLAGIEKECPTLRGAVRQLFGGLLLCCLAFSVMLCVGVWAYRHAYPPKEEEAEAGVFKVADEENPDEPGSVNENAPPPPASASTLAAADVPGDAKK
jgi:hypothetical protein